MLQDVGGDRPTDRGDLEIRVVDQLASGSHESHGIFQDLTRGTAADLLCESPANAQDQGGRGLFDHLVQRPAQLGRELATRPYVTNWLRRNVG
jgi:hypothetical protein